MKNASIVILSLALAAAVAFGIVSRKSLVETRNTLETEQMSHRTAVRNLESTLRERDRSTRDLSGEIDRVRTELNLAKASEAAVTGRFATLEKQYRQQVGSLRDEISSLKIQRDSAEDEIATLRSECESKVSELNNLLRQNTEEVQALRQSLERVKRQAEETATLTAAQTASMANEKARLRGALESADAHNEAIRIEMETLRAQCENRVGELNNEIELRNEDINRLENALSEMERESVLLEDRLLSLTGMWEMRFARKKEELSKLSNAERAKRAAESLLEEERRKAAVLEENLLSVEKNLQNLAQELEAKEQAARSVESQMNEALETARKFREENVSLEKRLALVTAEAEANEKARSDLQVSLEEERRKSESLSEKRSMLERRIAVLGEELDSREEAFSIVSNARSHDQQRVIELEDELRDAETRMESMTADLKRVGTESSHLQYQLTELKEACRKQVESLESTSRAKDAEIDELNDDLQEARGSLDQLQAKIMDASSTMESLRSETQALRRKASHKEQEIEAVRNTYASLVADLRRELDRREVRIQHIEEMISLEVVDSILFPPGRASITPEGERLLRKVGDVLKGVENRKVRVIGHTDDIPIKAEYRKVFPTNWELSAARACAVVRFFQHRAGLSPSVLEPVGRSFYDPVADNATPEGRALNRRVTITVGPVLKTP